MESCCRPALLTENWDDPPATEGRGGQRQERKEKKKEFQEGKTEE